MGLLAMLVEVCYLSVANSLSITWCLTGLTSNMELDTASVVSELNVKCPLLLSLGT